MAIMLSEEEIPVSQYSRIKDTPGICEGRWGVVFNRTLRALKTDKG